MAKSEALELHSRLGGKLEVRPKISLNSKKILSLVYTPGVGDVCREIYKRKNPQDYTIKRNTVAIVSDGSAVLGYGNLGADAAIPVMEGKAMLFKELAGIDAFPICIKTQEPDEIVNIVRNISPVFGGINLEDISAPRCFEVEESLQDIGIPVMHDDQHGTAIVVLAALLNSSRILKKRFEDLKVVMTGSGAAGSAVSKLILGIGLKDAQKVDDVIVCDSKGIIYQGRKRLNSYKRELARITNKKRIEGHLEDALEGADVFIGVSKANIITESMIRKMNKDPVIFALANPAPEIMPDRAKKAGAAIVATGRSDFPNQVNNALAFPGVFRGALDSGAKNITQEMKLKAALALAGTVKNPHKNMILPGIFDKNVVKNVAKAVMSV